MPSILTMQVQPEWRFRAASVDELAVDPKSIDEATREFDMVWSTGARAPMFGYVEDVGVIQYDEELAMDDASWDTTRVRNGICPLIDSHGHGRAAGGMPDSDDMLGVVLKVWFKGGKGYARCRFSERPELAGKWSDVKRGILRGASPRYIPSRYVEITGKGDKRRTFRPRRCELREISLVPINADSGARVRSGNEVFEVEVEIDQEMNMDPKDKIEPVTPADDKVRAAALEPQPAPAPERAAEPAVIDLGKIRVAERERCEKIRAAAATIGLPVDDETIAASINGDIPYERARGEMFLRKAALDRTNASSGTIRVGDSQLDKLRAGVQNALYVQVHAKDDDGKPIAVTDHGREFMRMGPLRMGERWLQGIGIDTTRLGKRELAGALLGLEPELFRSSSGGMAASSDFPLLLANMSGKVLREGYHASESKWRTLSNKRTAPDFKQMSSLVFGENATLQKVGEHGERKRGKLIEGREQYRIDTFAEDFAFTRQLMINDDLNALQQMPTLLANMVTEFEANLMWALVTANPIMADGNAVFSVAHGNISAPLALDQTGLETIMIKLGTQKKLDGTTPMNLPPSYLLVPLALKVKGIKETSAVNPNATSTVNPFVGMFEEIIAEPRLDVVSTVDWYVVTKPSRMVGLQYAYLEGNEGPFMDHYTDPRTEGLVMSVREDFGGAFIEFRSWQFANN